MSDNKFSLRAFIIAIIVLFFAFYGLKTYDKVHFNHKQYLARQAISQLPNLVIRDYSHEVYQLSSIR